LPDIREPGESMGKKKGKAAADMNQYAPDSQNAEENRDATPAEELENENPPRTTSKGWFTTPKFGSATSGGGEIEPGPERD
jgi:hypothetical protein